MLSLTDTLGSLTVASKGHYMTGVSTDIGTSFVKPAGRVGDILYAKATLTGMGEQPSSMMYLPELNGINIGKSLAYSRVEFTNPNGDLVAYGCKLTSFFQGVFSLLLTTVTHSDHTKYIGKSSQHPVSVKRRSLIHRAC